MRNYTWFKSLSYLSTVFVIILLFGGSPAIAQDTTGEPENTGTSESTEPLTPAITPTPTPSVSPVILTWSEEMFFPQAVSFQIAIGLPLDQIRVITLVIEVEGQPARAIPMNELFRSAAADEQHTEIEHIWNVTPNDLVPISSIINYHWDITTAQGEFISVPGVVDYNARGANWVLDEDPNNRLSFIYPADVMNVGALRNSLESAYDLLATHTGQNPRYRLALFSNKAPLEPCQLNADGILVVTGHYDTELACEEPIMDTLISNLGYTPFEMASSRTSGILQELVQHFVDTSYGPVWAGRDIPDWFKVGLTYVYLPSDKTYLLGPLRDATRNRSLWTLAEMNRRPDPTSPDLSLWEAQSFGMVTYMASQIGIEKLFEFANNAGIGEPFSPSYEEAVEQPLEALLPNLNNWIFSTAAATDFGLLLYVGPTRIPTRTLTPTPFPPSPTFTATDTPTITPTATVTGFLSATPLPSHTPTITLTPEPPTVTPRPAGYQDPTTPTPTPVPPPADKGPLEDLGDQQIVGIAAVIIIGLLVLVAVYLQARQRPRW